MKKQQKQKQTIIFASLALILVVGGYFGGHALGWWGAFSTSESISPYIDNTDKDPTADPIYVPYQPPVVYYPPVVYVPIEPEPTPIPPQPIETIVEEIVTYIPVDSSPVVEEVVDLVDISIPECEIPIYIYEEPEEEVIIYIPLDPEDDPIDMEPELVEPEEEVNVEIYYPFDPEPEDPSMTEEEAISEIKSFIFQGFSRNLLYIGIGIVLIGATSIILLKKRK